MSHQIRMLIRHLHVSAEEFLALIRECFSGKSSHVAPDISTLENRVLLSATPVPSELLEFASSNPSQIEQTAFAFDLPNVNREMAATDPIEVDDPLTNLAATNLAATNLAATNLAATDRQELVFVDATVANYQLMLDDLAMKEDVDYQFIVLKHQIDGIDQITSALQDRQDLDAIHFVTHGTDTSVKLGNVWLNLENVAAYAGQIAAWEMALSTDADLLFWGCELAASDSGRELLESIAVLTGSDVAASVDDTGHAQFAGDWELEFSTSGAIETRGLFSETFQQSWQSKLAAINVTTFNDVIDSGDGLVSLREAIQSANTGSGGDTILLPAGTYTLTVGPNGDNQANRGDLDVRRSMSIIGAGADTTFVDGNGIDRVFHIFNNSTVASISGVTIQGGVTGGNGAGIWVDDSSTLSLTDVAIVANNATGSGGGLYSTGTTNLERVLIANNSAANGAGIALSSAVSTDLINVTVSTNTASTDGGGIWSDVPVTVTNSTIAFNTAASGGGIFDANGSQVTLASSILHNPLSTNANGTLNSAGFNIDSDGSAALNGESDLTTDPLLNSLGNNGGPIFTHSLQTGSAAINSGANLATVTVDQTGKTRDVLPDIGAFEATSSSTKIFWSDSSNNQILRGNDDGSATQILTNVAQSPHGFGIDSSGGKIYWTTVAGLFRANLDGSGVETLNTVNLVNPKGIGLDLANGHVYVADDGGGVDAAIRRFNLDGTGFTTLVDNLGGVVNDVAVDAVGDQVYIAFDGGGFLGGEIQQVAMGGGPVTVLKGSLLGPTSIAIDQPNGRLYYTDDGTSFNAFVSLDLYDGTGTDVIQTFGLDAPFGAFLDQTLSKVYWSDSSTNLIRRAELDGTNDEDVLTGLNGPFEFAVLSFAELNTDPVSNAGGVYEIAEGESLALDGSASGDYDGDPLTYAWDLNNDSVFGDVTGQSPIVSWSALQSFGIIDDGTYTIGLQVDDGNGGIHSATTTVVVTNSAPNISTTGASTVEANSLYTLNLSVVDAGTDTVTSWTINWGDGTIETVAGNPATATHTYTSTFTFGILASVTDEDGTYVQNELLTTGYSTDRIYRLDTNSGSLLQEIAVPEAPDAPVDVEIGPDGLLYVSSYGTGEVLRYNAETGVFVDTWIPAGEPGLSRAAGMVFGPDGNLYVADYGSNRVSRFDASGAYVDDFVDVDSGGLRDPYDIIFGPDGNLYVNSYFNANVLRFDGETGDFMAQVVAPGAGGLLSPEQMTFGPDGHLYVSSFGSDEVLKYDGSDGTFLGAFIPSSSGLDNPTGLAFGPDGHLYVADYVDDAIQRYDGDTGTFIDIPFSQGTSGFRNPALMGFLPEQQVTVTSPPVTIPTADAGGPYTTDEGASLTLDASGSTDPSSDPLTFTWDLDNDGLFDDAVGVSPVLSWAQLQTIGITDNGTFAISVRANDGTGGIDGDSTTLTVNNVNPNSVDDSGTGFQTDEETPLTTTNVLANDTDPADAADPLSVVGIDTTLTLGAVVDNGDGTFNYDPTGAFDFLAAGQSTTDSFDYTVSDGDGGISTSTVTISVTGVNDAPVLTPATPSLGSMTASDTLTPVSVSTMLAVSVSDADTGAVSGIAIHGWTGLGTWEYSTDGTTWNLIGSVNPSNALLLLGSAQLRYTGDGSTAETAVVHYRAWDETGTTVGLEGTKQSVVALGTGDSNPLSVNANSATVTVGSGNSNPVAVDDAYAVNEGGVLNRTVISNWFNPNWKTRQQLFFNNSAQASALNDFPVLVKLHASAADAVNIDYSLVQDSGQDLRFVDANGAVLDYEIELWDESGYSSVWVKVPQIDAASSSDFIWMYFNNDTATDAQNTGAVWSTGQVAVLHMNTTSFDSSSFGNDGGVINTAQANGIVAGSGLFDGASSAISLFSDSSLDNVFAGGGTISAWINPSDWGENGFGRILDKANSVFGSNGNGWTFQVGDVAGSGYLMFNHGFSSAFGEWRTDVGSISLDTWHHIVLEYDNSSPTSTPTIYIDGDSVNVNTTQTPNGSALSDDALDLFIGNYSQSTNRTFDGHIDEVRIETTSVNADWVAASYLSQSGGFVSSSSPQNGPGGVLQNDFDADMDGLSVTLVSGPSFAANFTLNADGSFSYEHNGAESANDSFTYRIHDGFGGVNNGVVNLTINPSNDDPAAANDTYSVDEGATINPDATTGVLNNDVDPESDSLSVSLISGPSNASFFVLNSDGSFTYTHDGSNTSSDSFDYQIDDGNGGTDVATVNLSINLQNDPPIAVDDAYFVDEGASLSVLVSNGVLLNDSDPESNLLTAVLVSGPTRASNFALQTDGSFVYEHDGSESISDSFTYRANDGTSSSGLATVTISINAINDLPTVTLTNIDSTINENTDTSSSIRIADIVVSDNDATGNNQLSLSGGHFANFEIVGNELHLRAGTALDFESQVVYAVSVDVTDISEDFIVDDSMSETLTVVDVNESPSVALANQIFTLPENSVTTSGIKIADIVITDDALGVNQLVLGGTDRAWFEIVGSELRLIVGANLNFETASSLQVSVEVDDPALGSSFEDFAAHTLAVTDQNDAPSASFENVILAISTDTNLTAFTKIADVVILDDALGSYTSWLTGAHGSFFQLVNNDLYLRAGLDLSSFSSGTLEVGLALDDPTIPGSPDVVQPLSVNVGIIAPAPVPDESSSSSSSPSEETESQNDSEDTFDEIGVGLVIGSSENSNDEIDAVDFQRQRASEEFLGIGNHLDVVEPLRSLNGTKQDSGFILVRNRSDSTDVFESMYTRSSGLMYDIDSALKYRVNESVFWNQLDTLQDSVEDSMRVDHFVVRAVGAATSSLTVGYMIWILRGGALMTSLLAQMPAWTFMDPMVILSEVGDYDDQDDDDSLEAIVDSQDSPIENSLA